MVYDLVDDRAKGNVDDDSEIVRGRMDVCMNFWLCIPICRVQ